jgi:hypothetical protein
MYLVNKQIRLIRSIEDMKFDVVVVNPPYNNDIYLKFVETGNNLASQCSVFITPAKWQAKGGEKNEQFRKNIVPHISKLVYYPEETEVFDINCGGGISYYLIDKDTHTYTEETYRLAKQNYSFKNDLKETLYPDYILNIFIKNVAKKNIVEKMKGSIYVKDKGHMIKKDTLIFMTGALLWHSMELPWLPLRQSFPIN